MTPQGMQDVAALADPLGPRRCPSLRSPGFFAGLCETADAHGVLPAVAQNLRVLIEAGYVGKRQSEAETFLKSATERLTARTVVALVIRRQRAEILDAFSAKSLPILTLKGPVFADRLYPEPSLRTFTDLDLLVPAAAHDVAETELARLGYQRDPERDTAHTGRHAQHTWRRAEPHFSPVELHTNLVNSPSLRRRVSLAYEDIAPDASAPELTASALLLIAAIHGATGHVFDRLQHVVDIAQASRGVAGPVDTEWLVAAATRTGSIIPVTAGLSLAETMYAEPACAEILRPLPQSDAVRRAVWLLSPAVVLRRRSLISRLRRQAFRAIMERF